MPDTGGRFMAYNFGLVFEQYLQRWTFCMFNIFEYWTGIQIVRMITWLRNFSFWYWILKSPYFGCFWYIECLLYSLFSYQKKLILCIFFVDLKLTRTENRTARVGSSRIRTLLAKMVEPKADFRKKVFEGKTEMGLYGASEFPVCSRNWFCKK